MHGDIREELRDLRIKYNSIVDALDILRVSSISDYVDRLPILFRISTNTSTTITIMHCMRNDFDVR